MTGPPEITLIVCAAALALVAIVLAVPRARWPWRSYVALVVGALGAVTPLVAFAVREPGGDAGRALWEWSAAGGPTVEASYRFDGLGALGVAAIVAYVSAGLVAAERATRRRQALPGIVLATGFVGIALAVTIDLVAATVVLGVMAALTALAELVIAPATASARLAAFFAIGVQSFVVAALLVSRSGGASFRFDVVPPTAMTPGVVLAASCAAALFAGLYPFVPWRFEGETAPLPEREPLRGLLAMPVGIGATLVLARVLGATRIELSTLALPQVDPLVRGVAAALVIAAVFALLAFRRAAPPAPRLVAVAALLAGIAAYPLLHWSHVVLVAALLAIVYAAGVAFADPEQWEVVRYDVALAALWIGVAVGTPLSIAGGLFVIVADAAAALAGAVWLPPHRWYIATVATATAFLAGTLAIGVGIRSAPDPATQVLAVLALAALVVLALVQIGWDLRDTEVPPPLEATAALGALLVTLLLALLAAPVIAVALERTMARPLGGLGSAGVFILPAIVVGATLVVIVARTARPFLPDLRPVAAGLRGVVAAADPVPAMLASYRVLADVSTGSSMLFAAFERRAGVWLAALLIVVLLVWATRT